MLIGQVFPQEREIELNAGKKTIQLEVTNAGDRPVQVGSHFHFFEVNKMLAFDRAAAFGYRLDVPSGNAVRFEPGETKTVTFTVTEDKLRFYDAECNYISEAGEFVIFTGYADHRFKEARFDLVK